MRVFVLFIPCCLRVRVFIFVMPACSFDSVLHGCWYVLFRVTCVFVCFVFLASHVTQLDQQSHPLPPIPSASSHRFNQYLKAPRTNFDDFMKAMLAVFQVRNLNNIRRTQLPKMATVRCACNTSCSTSASFPFEG